MTIETGENIMETIAKYPLCATSQQAGDVWRPVECGRVEAAPHMEELIACVGKHLDAGVFYTSDMLAAVLKDYEGRLTPEEIERGRGRVEGGVFGMEVYYARDTLEARRRLAAMKAAHDQLNPVNGMALGSLIFNDFKLTTTCTITAVDGLEVTIQGKRGRTRVTCKTTAQALKFAADRALERGKRKASLF